MTTITRAHAGAAFPYLILAALLALLATMLTGAPTDQDAAEAIAADLVDAVALASEGGAR